MGTTLGRSIDIDPVDKQILNELRLNQSDIKKLLKTFHYIDLDCTNRVRREEFFAYCRIEPTPTNIEIFSLCDTDNSGSLIFSEFVCTLWNLLSYRREDLGGFVFDLADKRKTGKIAESDIPQLLISIHHKNYANNKSVQKLVQELQVSRKGCTREAFVQWTNENPSALAPISGLHHHLRSKIVGQSLWRRCEEARYSIPRLQQPNLMKDIRKMLKGRKLHLNVVHQLSTVVEVRNEDTLHMPNHQTAMSAQVATTQNTKKTRTRVRSFNSDDGDNPQSSNQMLNKPSSKPNSRSGSKPPSRHISRGNSVAPSRDGSRANSTNPSRDGSRANSACSDSGDGVTRKSGGSDMRSSISSTQDSFADVLRANTASLSHSVSDTRASGDNTMDHVRGRSRLTPEEEAELKRSLKAHIQAPASLMKHSKLKKSSDNPSETIELLDMEHGDDSDEEEKEIDDDMLRRKQKRESNAKKRNKRLEHQHRTDPYFREGRTHLRYRKDKIADTD